MKSVNLRGKVILYSTSSIILYCQGVAATNEDFALRGDALGILNYGKISS